MKKIVIAVSCIISIIACQQKEDNSTSTAATSATSASTASSSIAQSTATSTATETDKSLVTKTAFAGITSTTTVEQLKTLFGESAVTEGKEPRSPDSDETVAVTIVHKDKPEEIVVRWIDGKQYKAVGHVACRKPKAPYHTPDGVKIGTTLEELTQMNKDVISFSGVAWDLGGYITNYGKAGVLGKNEQSDYSVRLGALLDNYPQDFPMGDQIFNTTQPVVKKHAKTLTVMELSIAFY